MDDKSAANLPGSLILCARLGSRATAPSLPFAPFSYNLLPKKHRLLSLLPNSRQEVYIFQENSKSNHFLCSYYPETSHSEPSRFMSQGKLPFLPHRPPGTCPSSQPSLKCEDLISRRRKEQ